MELVDVSMAEVLVAWSALGECSLELLEVLSISDGMMIDDLGAALVTWNDLLWDKNNRGIERVYVYVYNAMEIYWLENWKCSVG